MCRFSRSCDYHFAKLIKFRSFIKYETKQGVYPGVRGLPRVSWTLRPLGLGENSANLDAAVAPAESISPNKAVFARPPRFRSPSARLSLLLRMKCAT